MAASRKGAKSRIGFNTRAVHSGEEGCPLTGAVSTPIYQTSTFSLKPPSKEQALPGGMQYVYTRVANPTTSALETKIADLAGGEAGLALASGMAAISAVLFTLVGSGDHIVCSDVIYGCTHDLLKGVMRRMGVESTFVDLSEPDNLAGAVRDNTRLVFLETPANPTLKLINIRSISDIAGEYGIKAIVDNTFMTPYLQRPLELGADIVVHSATKYISGHGDTIGGIIVGDEDFIREVRGEALKDIGGCISPFNSWLLLRGVKTMGLRMERHSSSALEIARFLESHSMVRTVMYPGLKSHPQHGLAKLQHQCGSSGMITFDVETQYNAIKVLDSLEMCTMAVSLGDVNTLLEHPATMTHRSLSRKERHDLGINDGLLRISVGIEDSADIIADIDQALSKVRYKK